MRSRTVRATSWILAGRIVRVPVSILVTAVLARLLLPADFGVIAFVTTLAGFAIVVFDGSVGINIVRRKHLEEGEVGTSIYVALAAGLLIMVAALAAAGPLERWMEMPRLAATLSAVALTLPASAAASVFNALLQRHNHFRTLVLASLLGQIVYAAVAIALALEGYGVWALAWGLIAGRLAEVAMNGLSARRLIEWRARGVLLGRIVSEGGVFMTARILSWGSAGFDKLAAGQLGAAALGYYSRASSLFVMANQSLGAGLMRALLSSFAHISDERERLGRGYVRVVQAMLLVSLVAAANVILFAPELVRILLGPGWEEVVAPLRILFIGFVARSLNSAAEALTATVASNRQNIARQAAQFALVVTGVLIGLRYGIAGVAAGLAIALWAFYAINLVAVSKWMKLDVRALAAAHVRPLVLAAPTVLATSVFVVSAHGDLAPLAFLAIGEAIFLAALVLTLQLAPASLLGPDLTEVRSLALSALRRRRA